MNEVEQRHSRQKRMIERLRWVSESLRDVTPAAREGDIAEVREIVKEARQILNELVVDMPSARLDESRAEWYSLQKLQAERISHFAIESVAHGLHPQGFFVYFLWEHPLAEKPIYIGQSKSLLPRLGSHMSDPEKNKRVKLVTLIRCGTEREMCLMESRLISWFKPELNVMGLNAAWDNRYPRNHVDQAI